MSVNQINDAEAMLSRPLTQDEIPFADFPSALQYASNALSAGQSVLIRPLDHDGYVCAVLPIQSILGAPKHIPADPFAETLPIVNGGQEPRLFGGQTAVLDETCRSSVCR